MESQLLVCSSNDSLRMSIPRDGIRSAAAVWSNKRFSCLRLEAQLLPQLQVRFSLCTSEHGL